jgi:hypothetical protein
VLLLFTGLLLSRAFAIRTTCKIKKQNRRGWKCLKEEALAL